MKFKHVCWPFVFSVLTVLAGCLGGDDITSEEPVPPSNFSYAVDTVVYTAGAPIVANPPQVTGTVSLYSVEPLLPPGMKLDSLTGVISGTPTTGAVSGMYVITARNASGSTQTVVHITVNLPAPLDSSLLIKAWIMTALTYDPPFESCDLCDMIFPQPCGKLSFHSTGTFLQNDDGCFDWGWNGSGGTWALNTLQGVLELLPQTGNPRTVAVELLTPLMLRTSWTSYFDGSSRRWTATYSPYDGTILPEGPLPSCVDKVSGRSVVKLNVTANCMLHPDSTYHLTGLTSVKTGATLTIGAGAIVKGRADGAITALIVERGAKINAVGTSTKPIVFTSGRTSQQRGDFGGVVILGSAPMNAATGTGEIEGLVGVPYGGTNAADSSGELKYVRIEYAGRMLGANNELNGLTLGGVGSKTKISHVQIYEGLDDGFEWFGGTVSASHLVVLGTDDDMFDWDAGWNGTLQFALGVHNLSVNTDANGIEADNQAGLEEAMPRSSPRVANITLIGNGITSLNGMRLRRGTGGQITNALVTGFRAGRALRLDGNASIRLVNNDSLKGFGIYAYNNGGRTNVAAAAGLADSVATVAATIAKLGTWFTTDTASAGVSINTWRPTITPAGSVATPAGMTTANYIGAFDPAAPTLWTSGWVRGY